MNGHEQPEKLVQRLSTWVIFPNMKVITERVVGLCGPCQAAKRKGKSGGSPITKTDIPDSIMTILSIDASAPYKTAGGWAYVVYAMDHFSRHIWIGITTSKHPKAMFEFLMDRVFTQFGLIPEHGRIISDNEHYLN